jgi:uncharacterized membrane protein YgcG
MKHWFALLFFAIAVSTSPVQAVASTYEEAIIEQLMEQGFSDVQVSKTFLGRLRFVASAGQQRREIVINPYTGEILRDYLYEVTSDGRTRPSAPKIISTGNSGGSGTGGSTGGSGSGTGGSGSDDSEDDDHEDDDHDDDHEDDDHEDRDRKDRDDKDDKEDDRHRDD